MSIDPFASLLEEPKYSAIFLRIDVLVVGMTKDSEDVVTSILDGM